MTISLPRIEVMTASFWKTMVPPLSVATPPLALRMALAFMVSVALLVSVTDPILIELAKVLLLRVRFAATVVLFHGLLLIPSVSGVYSPAVSGRALLEASNVTKSVPEPVLDRSPTANGIILTLGVPAVPALPIKVGALACTALFPP